MTDKKKLDSIEKIEQQVEKTGLPVVCVQGLGFVGAAMAIVVASASDQAGNPRFNVIGVDLPLPKEWKESRPSIKVGFLSPRSIKN